MKQWFMIITLLVISALIAACSSAVAATKNKLDTDLTGLQFETKTNSENAVMVEVTPLNLASGETTLDFAVAFNTHSVDLTFDPTTIGVLRDNQGREYPALSWDGAGPGGHHRSGTLRFKVPDDATGSVELVLKDVAGIPERVFRWNLMES